MILDPQLIASILSRQPMQLAGLDKGLPNFREGQTFPGDLPISKPDANQPVINPEDVRKFRGVRPPIQLGPGQVGWATS